MATKNLHFEKFKKFVEIILSDKPGQCKDEADPVVCFCAELELWLERWRPDIKMELD